MAHVQGTFGTMGAASGVTSANAVGSAVGLGNMVVGGVVISHATTSNLTSVTDDKGNTYTIRQTIAGGTQGWLATFDLSNITNGPSTITANFGSGGVSFPQVIWDEYSGVNGTDGNTGRNVSTSASGTDNISTVSLTPTQANDTLWGVLINLNVLAGQTAGTGFTQREQDTNVGDWGITSEDKALSTPAAVAVTFSTSASTTQAWIVDAVLLKGIFIPPTRVRRNFVLPIYQPRG